MKTLSTLSLVACIFLAGWWTLVELPPSRAGRILDCLVILFCDRPDFLYPLEENRPDDPLGNKVVNVLHRKGGSDYIRPHRFAFRTGEWGASPGKRGMRWWLVVIPLWSLVALTALLPATQLTVTLVRRNRLRRRIRAGLCTHCGYNLSGNASGTCPECGRASLPSG